MRLDLDALPQIGQPTSPDGIPLQLPVADIDEDPAQPRREFDAQALQELADSIAARGLLQAISVRHHPEQAQRWMVNFGARRLRACKLAGLTNIAATVNETASSYDQVIENEQREGLKPLELALFVQSRLALGESQAEIARQLGKSGPYVTYATALIDAPDWLMTAYRQGKCRGMAELYHLRRLYDRAPQQVLDCLTRQASISRSDILRLRDELGNETEVTGQGAGTELPDRSAGGPAAQTTPQQSELSIDGRADTSTPPTSPPATPSVQSAVAREETTPGVADRRRQQPTRLFGELRGQLVEIIVDDVPLAPGHVYTRQPGAAQATEVTAHDVVLIGFMAVAGT